LGADNKSSAHLAGGTFRCFFFLSQNLNPFVDLFGLSKQDKANNQDEGRKKGKQSKGAQGYEHNCDILGILYA